MYSCGSMYIYLSCQLLAICLIVYVLVTTAIEVSSPHLRIHCGIVYKYRYLLLGRYATQWYSSQWYSNQWYSKPMVFKTQWYLSYLLPILEIKLY